MIYKGIIAFTLLSCSVICYGQGLTLPNEDLIFSFNTQNGKTAVLNKDKSGSYIIYRFGTNDKIEFEFPGKTKSSFKNFKYSFYLRGGGAQNEGMDLNYVYFTNKGFQYVIYDTYEAVDNKQKTGVKITNLATNKTTDIAGKMKTKKGTLIDFRLNNLLEITDEMFD